jgi:serine/threonine-protein kinase HipA
MRLQEQVGAECAGAVQILAHCGATPQSSLAGIHDKVLLVAVPDDSWGWPQSGAASTHLTKSELRDGGVLTNLVQTEDWALPVARRTGMQAAESGLERFEEREPSSEPAMTAAPRGTATPGGFLSSTRACP